eukprot:jgi/Chlat1/810/Chrsp104S01274
MLSSGTQLAQAVESGGLSQLEEGLKAAGGLVCLRAIHRALSRVKNCSHISDASTPHDTLAAARANCALALDVAWEKLHTGPWRSVPIVWRDAYSLASLLLAHLTHTNNNDSHEVALKTLDLAALMGGPLFRPLIDVAINHISKEEKNLHDIRSYSQTEEGSLREAKKPRLETGCRNGDELCTPSLPEGAFQRDEIVRVSRPSLERFLVDFMSPGKPAVLRGCMDSWPALSKWTDVEYLKRVAGARTVPVEVGAHYLEDDWTQELMTLRTFVDEHLNRVDDVAGGNEAEVKAPPRRRYLAQHPLFEQIPALKADIDVPEYCFLSGGDGGYGDNDDVDGPAINAWFGPAGTVTPLHTDPKRNLLAQVVGRKYVRLYAPEHTDALYPHTSSMLRNSSQVDLDRVEHERFPLFKSVPYRDCVLSAGEMLYIPPLWWHYVRSLSVSFSVSFWW